MKRYIAVIGLLLADLGVRRVLLGCEELMHFMHAVANCEVASRALLATAIEPAFAQDDGHGAVPEWQVRHNACIAAVYAAAGASAAWTRGTGRRRVDVQEEAYGLIVDPVAGNGFEVGGAH